MARIPSLEQSLDRMTSTLRMMGDRVLSGLAILATHLERPSRDELVKLIVWNHEVDRLGSSVDDVVLQVLATQHPLAQDLRRAYSSVKISRIISQIGDAVQSLARQLVTRELSLHTDLLREMAQSARDLVHRCYVATFEGDTSLIQEIHTLDDAVDEADRQCYFQARTVLRDSRDFHVVEEALLLMHVASRLEKVADLACDWAKQIDFAVNGMARQQIGRFRDRVVFVDSDGGLSGSVVGSLLLRQAAGLVEVSVVTRNADKQGSRPDLSNLISDIGPMQVFPVASIQTTRLKRTLLVIVLGPEELTTQERDFVPYKSPILQWDDVSFGFLRQTSAGDFGKHPDGVASLARARCRVEQLVSLVARADER